MSKRKSFLLRLPPELLEELRRWSDDEMRSLNGQIEWVLRRALQDRGRKLPPGEDADDGADKNHE